MENFRKLLSPNDVCLINFITEFSGLKTKHASGCDFPGHLTMLLLSFSTFIVVYYISQWGSSAECVRGKHEKKTLKSQGNECYSLNLMCASFPF